MFHGHIPQCNMHHLGPLNGIPPPEQEADRCESNLSCSPSPPAKECELLYKVVGILQGSEIHADDRFAADLREAYSITPLA